jgi:hypothetical protein
VSNGFIFQQSGGIVVSNPAKPELTIDPPAAEILKIYGIASGFAFGYDPTGRSVFFYLN